MPVRAWRSAAHLRNEVGQGEVEPGGHRTDRNAGPHVVDEGAEHGRRIDGTIGDDEGIGPGRLQVPGGHPLELHGGLRFVGHLVPHPDQGTHRVEEASHARRGDALHGVLELGVQDRPFVLAGTLDGREVR